jgi:hypothetical protein
VLGVVREVAVLVGADDRRHGEEEGDRESKQDLAESGGSHEQAEVEVPFPFLLADAAERAGLPGVLADRDQFGYFLDHSYVPIPGEGATSNMFDVDELDQEQRAALRTLIALYEEGFGDADASGLLAILASRDIY